MDESTKAELASRRRQSAEHVRASLLSIQQVKDHVRQSKAAIVRSLRLLRSAGIRK